VRETSASKRFTIVSVFSMRRPASSVSTRRALPSGLPASSSTVTAIAPPWLITTSRTAPPLAESVAAFLAGA
jgi:hypothetical protein